MSYGYKYRTVFIPGVHLECDKIWDDREMKFKAENQMQWFLSKVPPTFPGEASSVANRIPRETI